jgi:hypothetical protein
MTTEEIRKLYEAKPFKPFIIHQANGRKIRVRHPEFMAFAPSGRTMYVYETDDTAHVVDIMLVLDLETKPNGSVRKRGTSH